MRVKARIKIGISSCLLGKNVRYDGGNKLDRGLRDLSAKIIQWVPVCPEVGCGLPVPREAMHLVGSPGKVRLVTVETGIDHTLRLARWSGRKGKQLAAEEISGFILKARSPSCGLRDAKISASGRRSRRGPGLFAEVLLTFFPSLPIEDEEGLRRPAAFRNFFERASLLHQWQNDVAKTGSLEELTAFHGAHRPEIGTHSPQLLRKLDTIISNAKKYKHIELLARYLFTLMDGMRLKKRHTGIAL